MARTGGIAAERLQQIVARIERLHEEKKAIEDDLKEVYAEAKGAGFDTKIIRQVVKLRKMDRAEFQEQEALLELYLEAIGMGTGRHADVDTGTDNANTDSRAQARVAREAGGTDLNEETDDQLYARAVEIVRKEGKASTSLVQRHLQIGYNRSARLVERMEAEGVVSKSDAAGKRTVIEFNAAPEQPASQVVEPASPEPPAPAPSSSAGAATKPATSAKDLPRGAADKLRKDPAVRKFAESIAKGEVKVTFNAGGQQTTLSADGKGGVQSESKMTGPPSADAQPSPAAVLRDALATAPADLENVF